MQPSLALLCLLPALLAALPTARAAVAPGRFDAVWAAYVGEIEQQALQPGCHPRRYQPPLRTARRGAVLALHGFSACPQQYFQLGPALAAAGFDVLVPTLPGHGRPRGPDGEDELSALPTEDDWAQAYGGFAVRMNRIMQASPGERIIIGYSLGGAVAINAVLREPALYERMLLIAPLVAVRGGSVVESLAGTAADLPWLRGRIVKPRRLQATCDGWTAAGRAGFCDYRYQHVGALLQLEGQNRDWLENRPLQLPVQFIVGDEDSVVSKGAIDELAKQQAAIGPVAVCELRGGVPHELLTPYENIGRPMHWLDRLMLTAIRFVADGRLSDCRQDPD